MKADTPPACGPLLYALASLVMTPILAVILLCSSAILLLITPVIPFIMYFERRRECRDYERRRTDAYRRAKGFPPMRPEQFT